MNYRFFSSNSNEIDASEFVLASVALLDGNIYWKEKERMNCIIYKCRKEIKIYLEAVEVFHNFF